MDSRRHRAEPAIPRLYLVTPRAEEADAFGTELAALLEAADVACVLLRLAEADERTLLDRIEALAPIVQGNGAALLIDGRADLAARSPADGAHLTGVGAFTAALGGLKPARIAGAGGLNTRHDAMAAAEAGADYVMFGEPDPTGRPPFAAIRERIAWWAEVFEVPCVGYAATLEEVALIAAAGADFIAVGDAVFTDPRGPAAAVRAASRLLVPEPA